MTAGRIRVLQESVINRIAAGEVVERPASVVKELLENSIDAGATRITVEVEGGGRSTIRVADDGSGMGRDDALLALQRHATSKIESDLDLFSVATLGFRGEAIPSIAAVSRFEMTTGLPGEPCGTRVVVDGGLVESVEDAPNPGGTEIQVRRLFFNTPVRAKFLKNPKTEMGHTTEAVQRIALSRPDVAFRLVAEGRTLLDAPQADALAPRVAAVLGRETAAGMRAVRADRGDLRLEGLLSGPSLNRSTAAGLHVYVNGRAVRDRTLTAAVVSAYRGAIPRGRHPIVVLFLDLPPDQVDVNVHPCKTEVRFLASGDVWRLVGSVLGDAISAMAAGEEQPEARGQSSLPAPRRPVPRRQSPVLPLGRSLASVAMDRAVPVAEVPRLVDPPGGASAEAIGERRVCTGRAAPWSDRLAVALREGGAWGASGERPPFADLEVLAQYERTFLLCQAGRDLVVIDQHAAHERVVFEKLRGAAGKLASQRLLVPELLHLDRGRTLALDDAAPLLQELGVELSAFGEDTIALQGVPAGLSATRTRRAILDLADEVLSGAGRERLVVDAMRYEIAALLACHTAVRAGDALGNDEIRALLRQLDGIEHAFACPHGRPTVVRFPRDEVARWFVRDS